MNGTLETLVQAWSSPLTGLFSAWGASAADAQELTQDVFVEAWLGRERCRFELDEVPAVGPWLRGIARNLWRSHRRKPRRERPLEALDEQEESRSAAPAAARSASAPRPGSPQEEALEQLQAAIALLPKGQREAIWVRYLEDRPSAEAAAILGLREHALAGRLWRARVTLRRRLNPTAPEHSTATIQDQI